MLAAFVAGATYASLARQHGISTTRAREIILKQARIRRVSMFTGKLGKSPLRTPAQLRQALAQAEEAQST